MSDDATVIVENMAYIRLKKNATSLGIQTNRQESDIRVESPLTQSNWVLRDSQGVKVDD